MGTVGTSKQRWAILNGFGISLGDSLIGLQALHTAQGLGAAPTLPVLYRKPGLHRMVDQLYPLTQDFAAVAALTEQIEPSLLLADGFDRAIDIRDFAFDPHFRGVAMSDFFLSRLGLDAEAVPSVLKRNLWLAPRVGPLPVPLKRTALVCPASSMPLRDMPEGAHERILRWLLDRGWDVQTQGRTPPALRGRVEQVPPQHQLTALCHLVAQARWIISVDTAMVHLADAFSVPSVAFFTTHRPAWRVRDYPHCQPVYLPPAGLPEALEFSRGPADVAATRAAWGQDLHWLDEIMSRFCPADARGNIALG